MDKNDDHFCDVIAKLKFISKITPNFKINTSDMSLIEPTWWAYVFRRFSGESQVETLNFLRELYENAFSLANYYYSKNDTPMVNDVLKCVKESYTGIDALKKTYNEYPMFTSRIEAMQMRFDTQFKTYES
jgi:hypothetical protein